MMEIYRRYFLISGLFFLICCKQQIKERKCGVEIYKSNKLVYKVECLDSGSVIKVDSFLNENDYVQRIINQKFNYEFAYINFINKEIVFDCYRNGKSILNIVRHPNERELVTGGNVIEIAPKVILKDTLYLKLFFIKPIFAETGTLTLIEKDSLSKDARVLIKKDNISERFFFLFEIPIKNNKSYWLYSDLTLNTGNKFLFRKKIDL